jgi:hypothetical protein
VLRLRGAPSPPAKQATARHEQTGQAGAHDGARHGSSGCELQVEKKLIANIGRIACNIDLNFIVAEQLQAQVAVALECTGHGPEAGGRARVDRSTKNILTGEFEVKPVDNVGAGGSNCARNAKRSCRC